MNYCKTRAYNSARNMRGTQYVLAIIIITVVIGACINENLICFFIPQRQVHLPGIKHKSKE